MKSYMLMLFLILVLVSCASSSTNIDTTPPTLVSSTPVPNGTGVALNSQLILNFSEAIDSESLSISSSPELNLGQAALSNSDKTATYALTTLSTGSLYTLSISVKDKAGNTSESITLSFTTQAASSDTTPPLPPVITQVTPGDAQLIIDWEANNETDLKDYTLFWGLAADALSNARPIPNQATSDTLTGLMNDTTYYVALTANDISGNSSLHSLIKSGIPKAPITPDTTAPTLFESNPANNAENVSVNTALNFIFSEAMNPASFSLSHPTVTFMTPNWSLGNTMVTLSPATALNAGQTYSFTLNAHDLAGNPLTNTMLNFSTAAATDTTPPATPLGFAASAGDARATLNWQANTESDLAGYVLSYGTTTALNNSLLIDKPQTSKALTGLINGTRYYFALESFDASGNHSAKTTVVQATPVSPAPTAPTITSTTPNDGETNVVEAGQNNIVINFSKPMDEASLESAVSFSPPYISFLSKSWSADHKSLGLSVLLEGEKTYTVTVAKTAKSQDGASLANPYSFSFTMANKGPLLLSSSPTDGAINVAKDLSTITLNFSEPIKPNFQVTKEFQCDATLLSSDKKLTLEGCELFDERTYSIDYTVQDLTGLESNGIILFSTIPDQGAPKITHTSPTSNQTSVTASGIYIYFDDEMDEASTLAAVSSTSSLGCEWKLSTSKDTLFCAPADLQTNTTYTITVKRSAEDTSGNILSCGASTAICVSTGFTFSTGPTIDTTRPTIDTNLSEPKNGATGVSLLSTINIAFSERMNQESAESAFSIVSNGSTVPGTFGWFGSGMVFFLETDTAFPNCSFVDVSIGTGAMDVAGNHIQTPYSIRFKTECF